jgi:hypothetical protein
MLTETATAPAYAVNGYSGDRPAEGVSVAGRM